MTYKRIAPVFLSLFLVACLKSTVVTEEERALPDDAAPLGTEQELPPELPSGEANDTNETSTPQPGTEPTPAAEPTVYTANLSQSLIAFVGKKGEAVSHEGKFTDFDFELSVVGNDLTEGTVTTTIDIKSLVTDSQGLTDHLLNEDFFAADTYPTATFTSSAIEVTDGNKANIVGTLTMHGVSKQVILPSFITDKYLTAAILLNRNDFGIGKPGGIDELIPVEIKVVFQ